MESGRRGNNQQENLFFCLEVILLGLSDFVKSLLSKYKKKYLKVGS